MNTTLRTYSFMADKDGDNVMVVVKGISIARAMAEAEKFLESNEYNLRLYKIEYI